MATAVQLTTEQKQQERRQRCIAALRILADKLEAYPELPVPYFGASVIRVHSKAEMLRCASILGSAWRKDSTTDHFWLNQKPDESYGTPSVSICAARALICKRTVTGRVQIAEQVIPASVIPAHVEEVVEWHCPDSLAEDSSPISTNSADYLPPGTSEKQIGTLDPEEPGAE